MAYSSDFHTPKKRRRPRTWLILLALALLLVGLAVWRVGPEPQLSMETDVPGVGKATAVTATAREPSRGLGHLRLELRQGERSWLLGEERHQPRPFWAFWGHRTQTVTLQAVVDGSQLDGLEEGDAELILVADRAPTWLRRPAPGVHRKVVPVGLRPPSVDVLHAVSVRQSGSGLVTYRVGASAAESGVQAGRHFFRGYPVPGGGPRDFFALFAVPYDSSDPSALRLVVRDALRNQLETRFVTNFTAKPLKASQIRLNDRFLDKVVGEIVSRTPGLNERDTRLATYLEINGGLRTLNDQELRALAATSAEEFLWVEPFVQQPNSQLMDDFAARRTYLYDGRTVDTQDHLGFDLASVRRAPIVASNRGRVVLARYLGIYGNTVVIDHGFGLQSLYAHLSSIDVQDGQVLERGAVLGRSGETGLAGGDHLHFAILVGGVPVDPLEWYDARWIETRIRR